MKCVEFTRLVSFTTGPASGFCACLSRISTFSTKDFGPVALVDPLSSGTPAERSCHVLERTMNVWRKRRISVTHYECRRMSLMISDRLQSCDCDSSGRYSDIYVMLIMHACPPECTGAFCIFWILFAIFCPLKSDFEFLVDWFPWLQRFLSELQWTVCMIILVGGLEHF